MITIRDIFRRSDKFNLTLSMDEPSSSLLAKRIDCEHPQCLAPKGQDCLPTQDMPVGGFHHSRLAEAVRKAIAVNLRPRNPEST